MDGHPEADGLLPHPDESLVGLIARRAHADQLVAPERLFDGLFSVRRFSPTISNLDPDSEDGRAAAARLGLSRGSFARLSTFHPEKGSSNLMGRQVSSDLVAVGNRQVCPACLRTSPHHRAIWLLTGLPACAEHGSWLLNKCLECSAELTWQGPSLCHCRNAECGADLRECDAPMLRADEVAGVDGLTRAWNGEAHPTGLDFGDLLRATLAVGYVRFGFERWISVTGILRGQRADVPRMLALGWETLLPWPGGFHACLEELLRRTRENPSLGLRRLDPLYGLLIRSRRHRWGAFLFSEMLDFTAGRTDIQLRAHALRGHVSGRREDMRHLTMNDAATVLGVTVNTVKRLSRRRQLEPEVLPGKRQRMIDPATIRRLAAEHDLRTGTLVSRTDAEAILGCSRRTVRALAAEGLLPEIPHTERIFARKAHRRAELEGFLATFEEAAAGVPHVDTPNGYRVPGHGGTRDGNGLVAIVRGVLDGSLRPVAIWTGGTGIQRYLFPRFMPVRSELPERRAAARRAVRDRAGKGHQPSG